MEQCISSLRGMQGHNMKISSGLILNSHSNTQETFKDSATWWHMVCLNTHHISYVIGTQYRAFWRQIQSINVVMKCGRNLVANPLSPRLIMFTEGGQLSWRPPQMEDTSISHQHAVCSLARELLNGTT